MAKLKATSVAGDLTVTGKVTSTVAGATTSTIGTVKLNNATNSTSTTEAATPSAVKAAYDLANGKANASHGNHVPGTQSANNAVYLRNDNTWQTITPDKIGGIAKNTGNILNNSSFGVGFLTSADSGSPWVAGYFGKNGGANQVVVGEVSATATIGAHNAAKNSWAELYVNNQKGHTTDSVKNKTVIGYPYAKEGTAEYRIYHTGYRPSAGDIGAATSSHGHSNATSSAHGFMSNTDKSKLDGIATGANNYSHPNDANTRHVTDTEKGSWNGAVTKANDWNSFKTSGGEIGGELTVKAPIKIEKDWTGFEMWNTSKSDFIRLVPDPLNMNLQIQSMRNGEPKANMVIAKNSFYPFGDNPSTLGVDIAPWKDIYLSGLHRSGNGYTKLPNGLILQWGVVLVTVGSGAAGSVNFRFPINFTNTPFTITGCTKYVNNEWNTWCANFNVAMAWADRETARCVVKDITGGANNSVQVCWVAIGY